MKPRRQVEACIARWGQAVTAIDGEESISFSAFIQSLRYKNKMYLNDVATPIGGFNQDYYLYIGPAQPMLQGAPGHTVLESGGKQYLTVKAEAVCLGTEVCYVWAVLRRLEEDVCSI